MRTKNWAAVAALSGMALAQQANAIVVGGASPATDYANLANSTAYNSVGQIFGTSGGGAFAASGVVIAQDWVLTAAHVTSGATSLQFYTDSGGLDFGRPSYTADRWYTYSQWNGNLGSGFDIGLMHLGSSLGCSGVNSDWGGCAANRYWGAGELNRVGTLIGYGTTGTGWTGGTSFDGLRRAGQNMIDAAYRSSDGGSRILLADFDSGFMRDNTMGSRSPLGLESLIAPGDSGGGLFEVIDGVNYLTGITSFGWGILDGNPDSDYGDAAGWTRVSAFNSWIDQVINGSAKTAAFDGTASGAQFAAAAVPEPSTWGMLLAGFGVLGFLARRRRDSGAA